MSAVRVNPFGDGGPPEAEVVLLPERAVWWPAARTLLVADLHLGKCEAMRAQGAPMTHAALATDLVRLASVIRRTEVERVIVLGDLLHAAAGVTQTLTESVREWRESTIDDVQIVVVPGNHDGKIEAVGGAWRLTIGEQEYREGSFAFCHDPEHGSARAGTYTWSGHVHPVATLHGSRDSLRLPCFHLGRWGGVLPAFASFSGGVALRRYDRDRVFVIAGDRVVPA